jgi:hypothetical protein
MSVLAAAFWSSHVIGCRSIPLTGWTHRSVFIGTAMRAARSCRHSFFMLHFLARHGAGTNGSWTGRTGRSLGLSRRNERRAEQRRNDNSRDRKFGSHRNISVGYTINPNPGRPIQFRRRANIA